MRTLTVALVGISALVFTAACGSTGDGGLTVDAAPVVDGGVFADAGGSTDAGQSACGTCPNGYICGSANGHDVCRSPAGVPVFTHVFVIVMENMSEDTLTAASNTPYLHGLMASAASATDFHGVTHPSLPNYIAMTSGDDQGIACDCEPTGTACNVITCNRFSSLFVTCGCPQAGVDHIGAQLTAKGMAWKDYAEDMGSACNLVTAADYATKHVPFLYYDDIGGDPTACAQHVADYGSFVGDLASAPKFSYISPNLTHDMHSPVPAGAQNAANGDAWLATEVPKILNSDAYKQGGILFIVWDEDDNSGIPNADDPIPLLVMSPLAKNGGFTGTTHADHYSLLATFEDGLGLTRLGMAAGAEPLAEFFPAQ